jgi:hypothetical protein
VYNTTQKRVYSGGDVISCFFGVVIGLFSLGQSMNQYKSVKEGCVAAKLAFEVIDRKAAIEETADGSIKHDI